MNLKNVSSIVTGGASGLGAATAKALANEGARVAILDTNISLAQRVADEIGGIALECNVTDETSTGRAFNMVREKHSAAKILINCAGIGSSGKNML